MKYLFDENISVSDRFLELNPGCANVKYHLGSGEKDERILKKTNKNEFIIVTKDIDFALHALIAGFKVIYRDVKKNQDHFLDANLLDESDMKGYKQLMQELQ